MSDTLLILYVLAWTNITFHGGFNNKRVDPECQFTCNYKFSFSTERFFFLEIFIINVSPEIKPHTSSEDPASRAVQLSYL